VTPVRFAPQVPDELAEAVLWYEARRSGLGEELLDEIDATLPLVGSRPRSFPRLQDVGASHEIRRALLARFPYAIVFLVRQEEVRVLAVAHVKRRPGYWLSRIRR
jgi:toxin ParE1/3/4